MPNINKITAVFLLLTVAGCYESDDKKAVCGNQIVEAGEECDGINMGNYTNACGALSPMLSGVLKCNASCKIDATGCTAVSCNHNGIKEAGEECDGQDFGGLNCASVTPLKPFGNLGCSDNCQISAQFCGIADLGLQAPNPDSEQTDIQCSNGLNDFNNKDARTGNSYIDCQNHGCLTSPIVQICHSIENNDAVCSDRIDNPTASNMPTGMSNVPNGLIDCADPSCFKNWRVTVCQDQAPKWELGAQCGDGQDNDGDGLMDCNDPDCLHVGMSNCQLVNKSHILFDNAHHQIAGAVDWIVDVTGRHPYPSIPRAETDWHGSLSSLGKDLMDTGKFVIETLPQDRSLSYGGNELQKLNDYKILVIVEPSSSFKDSEVQAIYQFVTNGGSLLLFANHKTSDRDANGVDAVTAINHLLSKLPGATSLQTNPFGFYVNENSDMNNGTASPSVNAASHPIIQGSAGNVATVGCYGGTTFTISDASKVQSLMTTDAGDYVIAATIGSGKIVAIGDSAIAGDGTNFLGISTGKNAYAKDYDNRVLLLNIFYWLK